MSVIPIEDVEVRQEGFVVNDDYSAEWALKRIADIDRECQRQINICQQHIEFYENKIDEEKQRRDRDRSYLLQLLEQYFDKVPAGHVKTTKTQAAVKLPSGKLVRKLEKQELVHNEESLINALKGTDFVEMKPKLKWGEYKKTLTILEESIETISGMERKYTVVDESGEIVEGVSVQIKPSSFDVEVSGV